jgi:integrase
LSTGVTLNVMNSLLRDSVPPKTAASVRTVPLADAVLAELAALVDGPLAPGALFVADNGAPIPQNRFSQTWARAVKRVGLPKGTRFHDLRHTYASALIAAGCSVKVVQSHLGHTSAAITRDTYSHLWPTDDDRSRAAVQSFFQGAVSSVCHARFPSDRSPAQSRKQARCRSRA